MNIEELIKKCRLTDKEMDSLTPSTDEVRQFCKSLSSNEVARWNELDEAERFLTALHIMTVRRVRDAQLRAAIPIIQEADKEKFKQLVRIPPPSEPYCRHCILIEDGQGFEEYDQCRLYGYKLELDREQGEYLRCKQCREEW